MKKFLLLAGVACLFSANAEAGVQLNQYVSLKASYDWNRVKFKDAFVEDGDYEIGYKHKNKNMFSSHVAYGVQAGFVRGEVELNNTPTIKFGGVDEDGYADHFRLNKYSVMANVYYDFLNCTSWTPYVGAGMGTSWLKGKAFDDGKYFDKSVYNLAWQVMAGVAYKVNSNWTVDAGYRYADLGRMRSHEVADWGWETSKMTLREHQILLGVRYTF